ncbi:CLUMA_CG017252, isoform A [Clunio marinus]|uniref:CLUMA_CG017252, isoform A n=1 Tax=Clunio marinus TaxID=568069 RepID=A0A1J1IVA4_9DIPT|nr:CLUMA_CG017252, isoform A [Clunio marinus]
MFSIFILVLIIFRNGVIAIHCDFRYDDSGNNYPESIIDFLLNEIKYNETDHNQLFPKNKRNDTPKQFLCDEELFEFEEEILMRSTTTAIPSTSLRPTYLPTHFTTTEESIETDSTSEDTNLDMDENTILRKGSTRFGNRFGHRMQRPIINSYYRPPSRGQSFFDAGIRTGFRGTTEASREVTFDFDDDEEEDSMCLTRERRIRPKALPNPTNNDLVTIINHGEILQTVKIEECLQPKQSCQYELSFPLGYTSVCKQKFFIQTFKALNDAKTEIIDREVYYPSGCECKIYNKKSKNKNQGNNEI